MSMTPDAKKLLATTIRALRARLLANLAARTQSVYQLDLKAKDANLDEATACKRRRLEEHLDDEVRAQRGRDKPRDAADFRQEVEQTAAYTLLNRLVVLRIMEATGLRRQALVTHGWESPAYKTFRDLAPTLRDDESEGYELLLHLVFEELAGELPGLYGPAGPGGVADLIEVPASTLRHAIEALDQPGLVSCWTDDMTLGWVYQYWNDPEREALDAKIHGGGKIAPHEIASKTQMFTERYMVDWLLQNSLGPMWLAMCQRHGWTAEADAHGTLADLEARRVEWRARRDRGEVSLTEMMPLHSETERRWAYYVPQPIPEGAVRQAPESVRDLKILDPAVGSGHFLVAAFELLVALYREEARHRGEEGHEDWSDKAIVEHIISDNLYGIDLDPRAVQIAAAALWLKAQQNCPEAHPRELHLVASNLRLANLPKDDPALVELRREVERETGIPGALTDKVVAAIAGAEHLGSLLQVDRAVEEALDKHEHQLTRATGEAAQGGLFSGFPQQQRALIGREEAKLSILEGLEGFLKKHTRGDDLGLRLRGEQLAAGVRFVRMVREGTYDLVIGNPPYQGTGKMQNPSYVQTVYKMARADLYAAFLVRGLQLARAGGTSALLTMRNWMFIRQFSELRQWLLKTHDLRALGDFERGAFEDIPDEVVSVVASAFRRSPPDTARSVAITPTPLDDRTRDGERTQRKRAAVVAQVRRHEFAPAKLQVVPEWPLIYWWSENELDGYSAMPKILDFGGAKKGLCTGNDSRFLRLVWEVPKADVFVARFDDTHSGRSTGWSPAVYGAKSKEWFEPLELVLRWHDRGLELSQFNSVSRGVAIRNVDFYFRIGVAFSAIGTVFSARIHRYQSVFGDKGPSVFPSNLPAAVCAMNSTRGKVTMRDLNPSISYQAGDVDRLPLWHVGDAETIVAMLDKVLGEHESHREPSVEFRLPGPSAWRRAQAWAQEAVDRREGAPLPAYVEELDPEPAIDHLSFALGVVLGRFGADGAGILDPTKNDLSHALPAGILFLNTTLDSNDLRDSLREPAAKPLLDAWRQYGPAIAPKGELRDYLASDFFEHHRKQYENRPIHWPLSSERRTFVAWITIHRWDASTLRILLADHLQPALNSIEGELRDVRAARDGADKTAARVAEKRLDRLQRAREELQAFIAAVEQCAEKGPPPVDAKCPARAIDARYEPDLDDGVMINAAALWPLFPVKQWKEPRKWWKELARAEGKKDYDWSHLAMRYWPQRVDDRCVTDPSLAVAHGCFWRYHPTRAWVWELRLQDEIGPDFRIEEVPYRGDGGHEAHRTIFLTDHPIDALAIVEKEVLRRMRKHSCFQDELRLLETGLWSAVPDQCWALELRIIKRYRAILKKQLLGSVWGDLKEFRLRAPDEEAARAAFIAGNPSAFRRRQQLLEAALDFVFTDEDEDQDDDVVDEAEAGAVADEADEEDDE
jgi:hypothetical protein